ncbi:MAG: hypothetical protein U9Q79_09615, partial [Candidatus Hydrogenedentes bacterium]|nr:hypothetical protein [Candidatus Hydrogenedentota bacterium]
EPVLPVPKTIGLLRSLRTELKTIFLFSNKVGEVPFRTLLAGQVQTTYGTEFNCIAACSPKVNCPRRNDGSPPANVMRDIRPCQPLRQSRHPHRRLREHDRAEPGKTGTVPITRAA